MAELEHELEESNSDFWEELDFFDILSDVYHDEDMSDLSSDTLQPGLIPKQEVSDPSGSSPLFVPEEASATSSDLPKVSSGNAHPSQRMTMVSASHSAMDHHGASNPQGEEKVKEEVLTKRKKAVLASKATREKKKRQINELRRSNEELMKERMEFTRIIAELQLQAQADRIAGEIDLETENELLRAELQEHKRFIAQFKRVADGSPVSNTEKYAALLKGAKAAVGQVVGLLHTSTVDPSWQRGYSRLHPELLVHYQRLPLGTSSKSASRINLRVDMPPVMAPMDVIHGIQWRVWSDSDLSKRLSSHFGQLREKEIKEIPLDLNDLEVEPDPSSKIKVYYYREKRLRSSKSTGKNKGKRKNKNKNTTGDAAGAAEPSDEIMDDLDTVFLTTSNKQDLPYNGTPIKQSHPGGLQGSGDPTVYPTIVMATTSTQHAKDVVSTKPGVHRIEAVMLEGLIIRQLEGGMISCTIMNSYPLNPADSDTNSSFLSSSHAEGWIDDEGYFTNAAEEAGNDNMKIFAECLGPDAAQAYAKEVIQAALAVNGSAEMAAGAPK